MGKRLGDISTVVTMDNSDSFIIIINGQEWLITKENLQKVFKGLTSEEYNALSKIIVNGSGAKFLNDSGAYVDLVNEFDRKQFEKTNGKITVIGYHAHSNLKLLERFTVDENNTLSFDGKAISSYSLPVASTTVLGGVKIDNDTIKINDEVISADVIGNWAAGTRYPVGYFAVHEGKLYECTVSNSDTVFDESKWLIILGGNAEGTVISNWKASVDYDIGNIVINGNVLYQCNTKHTSGGSFDEIEAANWTALSGEKGDKGDDGFSPTAVAEQTETGAVITVTDKNGTTSAALINGIDGTTPHIDATFKHWFIGETDTGVVAEGITTVQTTSVKYTGTLTVNGWVGDSAPYTQTLSINGLSGADNECPALDVVISDDIEIGIKENTEWCKITKAYTEKNSLTVLCYENRPSIDLNIIIKVV